VSRYTSLCAAIRIVEGIRGIFKTGSVQEQKSDEIRRDLMDIAKDVRYGGEWNGDYEIVAKCLESCVNMNCAVCGYRKMLQNGSCTEALKKDAAAAIRHLGRESAKREEATE